MIKHLKIHKFFETAVTSDSAFFKEQVEFDNREL